MTTFVALIELLEQHIAEIGEDDALTIARHRADRIAARKATNPVLQDATSQRQNFPRSNPYTGDELPPMRAYRFTYSTEDQP